MAGSNPIARVNIVFPSYNRAGVVAGYDYFRTAKIVIPDSQYDQYAAHYDEKRLIVVPDEFDGNIARKRNWILRHMSRPLLMMDDDVIEIQMTEGTYSQGRFLGGCRQHKRLSPDQAEEMIINGFNLAHQWGCVLWGTNVNVDGRNYQQYKPFSLKNVVLGPFQGHLEHDLFYDERLGLKEDYDFCLQVLNKYRKILRFNKFAYLCRHASNAGGVVSGRSLEREVENCRAIERKWGRHIIRYPLEPKKLSDLLNGSVNVPIAGV